MIHTYPHPGEILKETVFEPLELSVTEAADRLAMSRVALSRVLNGKAGISPVLALRLEKAGVSSARSRSTYRLTTTCGWPCSTSSRRCGHSKARQLEMIIATVRAENPECAQGWSGSRPCSRGAILPRANPVPCRARRSAPDECRRPQAPGRYDDDPIAIVWGIACALPVATSYRASRIAIRCASIGSDTARQP